MADVRDAPGGGGTANPGWYRDPWGVAAWRWWDGWQWTASTSGAPGGDMRTPYDPRYAAPAYADPERPVAMPKPEAVPAKSRRRLVAEVLIVMAAFPLPYTLSAIVNLVSAELGNGPGQRTPVLIKGHPGASFTFELIAIALPFAAAALVWYLLSSPSRFTGDPSGAPEGGLRAIGLDKGNLRGDLALVLAIFLICFAVPIDGGAVLLQALHVHTVSPTTGGVPKYFTLLDMFDGVTSGIVEEIVVLGYLVRRLDQLALRDWQVVAIAIAVRGSYHLYYGWGVLPILVWAGISVVLYRRYRRLLPFIIVHVIWDSSLFFATTLSKQGAAIFLLGEAGVLIPVTLVMWIVWRHKIPVKSTAHPAIGGTL